MIYLTQLFGSTIRSAYHNMWERKAEIYNHLQETFTNVKLIKACANEGYEINRFSCNSFLTVLKQNSSPNKA